jgi:hypothetical protein
MPKDERHTKEGRIAIESVKEACRRKSKKINPKQQVKTSCHELD